MNKSDNVELLASHPRLALRSPLTSQRPASSSPSHPSSTYESSNYLRYLSHLAAE